MAKDRIFHVTVADVRQPLGHFVRRAVGREGVANARTLVASRHVSVNGNLCTDESRKLKPGDVVHVFEHARAGVPTAGDVKIRFIDHDLMIVEKPAGMTTLRHAEERKWDERRRQKQPTLDEVLQQMVAHRKSMPAHGRHPLKKGARQRSMPAPPPKGPRVRPVHRLDRDTSGLMIFALSTPAEEALAHAFKTHAIQRSYLAVAHGNISGPMTIESWMVRDRGDGLRGSDPRGKDAPEAQRAVTHLEPVEHLGDRYTVVRCRLETGRTHQIRIRLAESGHMLCGEKVYVRPAPGARPIEDHSGAPRHALHSAELELIHPVTGERMSFNSEWPQDLAAWLTRLRDRSRQ